MITNKVIISIIIIISSSSSSSSSSCCCISCIIISCISWGCGDSRLVSPARGGEVPGCERSPAQDPPRPISARRLAVVGDAGSRAAGQAARQPGRECNVITNIANQ